MTLRNQAGNSVAEAYYNGVGVFIFVLSFVIPAILINLDRLIIYSKERKNLLEEILREHMENVNQYMEELEN